MCIPEGFLKVNQLDLLGQPCTCVFHGISVYIIQFKNCPIGHDSNSLIFHSCYRFLEDATSWYLFIKSKWAKILDSGDVLFQVYLLAVAEIDSSLGTLIASATSNFFPLQ